MDGHAAAATSDVSARGDVRRTSGAAKHRHQRSAGAVFRNCACSKLFEPIRKGEPGFFPGCDSFCSIACRDNPPDTAAAKGRSRHYRAVQEVLRNTRDSYARVGIPTLHAALVPDPSGGDDRLVVTAKNRDVAEVIRYLMLPRRDGEVNVKLTRIMGQVMG